MKEEQLSWEKDLEEATEAYIRSLKWSTQATEHEKTLVAGNIRSFSYKIKEDLADLPKNLLEKARREFKQEIREKIERTFGMTTTDQSKIEVYPIDHPHAGRTVFGKEWLNKADLLALLDE